MAGKEYAIVILSSSPPIPDAFNSPHYAAPSRRVAMPPSSPFALSPPSSPEKRASGALLSGSRAAPIPEKATRGFATVSSLVRSEHFAQQTDGDLAEIQHIQCRQGSHEATEKEAAAAKRPASRAAKRTTAAEKEKPKPKPKPKPRGRKPEVDKEPDIAKTTLDSELRLPRTTRSPFFDNAVTHTTADAPAELAPVAPKLTKSGKPRKPRVKKAESEGGDTRTKPKRTRVTKAKSAPADGKATQERANSVPARTADSKDRGNITDDAELRPANGEHKGGSGRHMPQSPHAKPTAHKQGRPDHVIEDLNLEEAVSRRRDWTPPRDTAAQIPSTVSTGKENRLSAHESLTGDFTHLISNFTYESPTSQSISAARTIKATSGVIKRRRVELVELPGVQTTSRAVSPEKGKAPKKKPRTITDLVTGQYAPKDINVEAEAVTSDFFSPRTHTTAVPLNDVAVASFETAQKKPQRKCSKSRDASETMTSKAKPRARKASTKPAAKSKPIAEKLLSPTSAVSRMNRQDLLFGTSSQLALEESPATVRQIQRAIKESEQDEGSQKIYSSRLPPPWPKLQRLEGKRGLWRESTRDSNGGLLENTENVYIPAPDRTQDLPLLMDIAREEPELPAEFADIDDILPPAPVVISSDLPTPPESQSEKQVVPRKLLSDTVFNDIDDFNGGPPPSNQNAESQNSFADIDDFQYAATTVPQPAVSSIADPPASAPVMAAAAGSPQERRGRPPKAKSAIPVILPSGLPAASRPLPSGQSSQRLPSTPPKGSGRFIDIEEILDSEDEALEAFSPTPPRLRKLQDSPPLPLAFDNDPSVSSKRKADKPSITPISRIQTSHLEWANIKPSVCAAITAHVRSIPPTTDSAKPSWHEKILMYDPIILEDFTAYLNSNTRLRTYKRATQKQIKVYNSNMKMQGNAILDVERDDQVLAVERELEVYMVRDWCQEMSICCIHAKESRGRGSARKGFY